MDLNKCKNKIANFDLAKWGRKEIEIAEQEMRGLIYIRKEFKGIKPLEGARISGLLCLTIQTAVYIETLKELGAEIRWSSSNIYATHDHAAAAIVEAKSANVFAWKGETLKEFWWCVYQTLLWDNDELTNLIVDDGGDLTTLIHLGVQAEIEYEKFGRLPNPDNEKLDDIKELFNLIKQVILSKKDFFRRTAASIVGGAEETTSGIYKLMQLAYEKKLLFPFINVNDSVTKTRFDNRYGCRQSFIDGLKRATDVMIAGKKVVVIGYGDVGKGTAQAMKEAGARVYISEIDPICAMQACMEGYHVVKVDSVLDSDIFVSATGNIFTITVNHMEKMKNNAIVCNVGNDDVEIDIFSLEKYPEIKKFNIKPLVDRYVFPDGHGIIVLAEGRIVNLSNATGNPSFAMSLSFSNQVFAQLELWKNRNNTISEIDVRTLPRVLDEKVARLHLEVLGAELTEMTDEQVKYSGIPKLGPYKNDDYRY